jgi:alpha-L-arabinofuranosidase
MKFLKLLTRNQYFPTRESQTASPELRCSISSQKCHSSSEAKFDRIVLPKVDAIAARGKNGKVWLSLSNLDPSNAAEVRASAPGVAASRAEGEVLTSANFNTVNTYEAPGAVAPKPFRASAQNGSLTLRLPPHSVTVVRLEPKHM